MTQSDPVEPSAGVVQTIFDELGRISFAEHSLDSLLQKVTDLAARALPGEPITSLTIVEDGRPSTVAASGELGVRLDQIQYDLGAGPCLTAATTGRPTEIVDTRADPTWPGFARAAADEGCDSVLAQPLPVQEKVSGSLNVYARRLGSADEGTRALLARFAAYAVVPVSNMFLYHSALERAQNLQAALDSRPVIDQAKGILMERFRLTPDQAFSALARLSMETNTKVRDVAQDIVETGEFRPA